MSLPPQTVRIKRKKDEEPVDALYIEQHPPHQSPHHQRKRRFTEFFFRRLDSRRRDDSAHGPESEPVPRNLVPTVGTDHAGDAPQAVAAPEYVSAGAGPASTSRRPSDAESVEGSGLSIPLPAIASTPRRFHLTKSASTTLLNHAHTYTARSGGVTKRKKAARPKIATFVEKSDPTDAPTKSQDHTGTLNPRRPAFDSVDGAAESEADTTGFPKPLPRKRPGATPQELAWRAQQWAKGKGKVSSSAGAPQKETGTAPTAEKSKEQSTSTDGPSTSSTSSSVKQWDYNSPELAALLEQITLEELRKGGGDRATPDSAPSAAPEIKPDSKGAVPVQYPDLKAYAAGLEGEVDEHAKQASMNPDHEMKDAEQHDGDGDDDGDYVYDTYVRHVSMVPSTLQDYDHEHHHKLKSDVNLHPPNIGILIVPPETIAEWEAYGDTIDDGLNDSDYEVDDEDENGKSNSEDYHGNDYPDEEDDDDDDESDEEDGNEDEDEDENEEGDEDGGDDHEDEETG